MTGDRNDVRVGDSATVPVDSIPDPVVGYDRLDGGPVVTETNDAFATQFDGVATGTSVRRWLLSETGVDESAVEDVCSSLASGEALDIEVDSQHGARAGDSGRYRLRTFDRGGDNGVADDASADTAVGDTGADTAADGYLLVTELASRGADSDEVDRIASVVSHDLRNPLDVANAHLRAARETGNEEHFDQVRESHDRMERIIRDVLTLARGEQALDVAADVDPGAVAADAWAAVDTRDASLDLGDDLPSVDADRDRLQRLFENLFRNSVEHARPDTDQSLQVRVGGTDGGLFVADDGVGIPDEKRERVFQAGYSGSEPGTGTGLGLTIVERIAEAHDWTVSLTNGSLGGARFEFLPSSGTD